MLLFVTRFVARHAVLAVQHRSEYKNNRRGLVGAQVGMSCVCVRGLPAGCLRRLSRRPEGNHSQADTFFLGITSIQQRVFFPGCSAVRSVGDRCRMGTKLSLVNRYMLLWLSGFFFSFLFFSVST